MQACSSGRERVVVEVLDETPKKENSFPSSTCWLSSEDSEEDSVACSAAGDQDAAELVEGEEVDWEATQELEEEEEGNGVLEREEKVSMQCCYLLTPCEGKKRGSLTYVGYTTDPCRRIKQHNGQRKGGAKKTKKHVWSMVCAVLGFPTSFSALSFEFAWQHPHKARLCREELKEYKGLKGIKGFGARSVKRKLVELKTMLCMCKPYTQFPLVLVFPEEDDYCFFRSLGTTDFAKGDRVLRMASGLTLPPHMRVERGQIEDTFKKYKQVFCVQKVVCETALTHSFRNSRSETSTLDFFAENSQSSVRCSICSLDFGDERPILSCSASISCSLIAHPTCLALLFLEGKVGEIIPQSGECPACGNVLSWPELIRDAKVFRVEKPGLFDSDERVD